MIELFQSYGAIIISAQRVAQHIFYPQKGSLVKGIAQLALNER